MKKLGFVNNAARVETRLLPADIRRALGFQLLRVQHGDLPRDFKPMKTIGSGVFEIRILSSSGSNVGRCFYVTKFDDVIWVLHSFLKSSRKTPRLSLEIGRRRLRELTENLRRGL